MTRGMGKRHMVELASYMMLGQMKGTENKIQYEPESAQDSQKQNIHSCLLVEAGEGMRGLGQNHWNLTMSKFFDQDVAKMASEVESKVYDRPAAGVIPVNKEKARKARNKCRV